MNIRKFRAIDMKTALARVREELGPHAVILGAKRVPKGEGSFGALARPLTEVTAALDEGGPSSGKGKRRQAPDQAIDEIREEIGVIKAMLKDGLAPGAASPGSLGRAAETADDLEELKSMLSFMMENSDFYKGAGLEPGYLACYRLMADRGLDRDFAMSLAREAREGVPGNRALDPASIASLVAGRIGDAMTTSGPVDRLEDGRPRVVSLVGPTGAGKTTTAAKIAARLSIGGRKVGLITIDAFRIAAVEQLRIYAAILGVPLEVALTPSELVDAVESMSEKDVVIVDTAGLSPRDSEKLSELASFLGGGAEMENLLVLSAASDAAALTDAVRAFGAAGVAGLVFTKMDETARPGVVVSQNLRTGIPIVYCAAGQRVPEDLEAASAEKIARLLLKGRLRGPEPAPAAGAEGAAHPEAGSVSV